MSRKAKKFIEQEKEATVKPVWLSVAALSVVVLVGVLAYSNTFSVPFHFDDETSIVNNFAIRNIRNLQNIWNVCPTRFITYLSLALNYHYNQLNVWGYHAFNLAAHIGSAILLYWFILLTFSTPMMKGQRITRSTRLVAFFAGLIFAVHPVQTQAVTYIIQRATSLAAFFYLASLSLYAKSRLLREGNMARGRWVAYYLGSLLTAVIAMFTKEITITLPLMIGCFELSFFRTRNRRFNWRYPWPFLSLLLIVPLTRIFSKAVNFGEIRSIANFAPNISPWHYLLTQFRVMVTYIRLAFLPLNQNLDYDYPIATTIFSLPVLASLLFLVTVIIVAFRLLRNHRLVSFGIFFFFLTLLPESSIIPILDVIYEHRLYLAMAGFSLFLVSGIYYLLENKNLKLTVIALLIISASYAVLAYRRNSVWKDEFSLWNDTVHKSPNIARPYNNRGISYAQKGKLDQAISDLNKAIELNPDYAAAYNSRGVSYAQKGKLDQAISDLSKAIELHPDYDQAYYNRGVSYNEKGDLNQAVSDYNKAIELNPDYDAAYNNRAVTYFLLREYAKAWDDVHKAESLGYKVSPKFLDSLKKTSGR